MSCAPAAAAFAPIAQSHALRWMAAGAPVLDVPALQVPPGVGWEAAALVSGADFTQRDEPFAAVDKTSIHCVREFLQEAATHTRRARGVANYAAPAGVSPGTGHRPG